MSKYLSISLIIVAAIVGLGAGYIISPQYKYNSEMMALAKQMDLGKADKYIDQRYIDAMIAHHRGAILLAEQVKDKSQRKEIKDLAQEIITSEPKAIDELYTWKKDWYKNTTRVKDRPVANLGTNDEKLDLRFLNALIAHHDLGIEMTEDIRTKSTRNEILNNADATEKFFVDTKNIFQDWRSDWYGIK
jgi:uncharacterized protein (DUF305 family)